jgi:hypothetical protein
MSLKLEDVFGYFIPTIILSQIFSGLLSLEDICRFDSAICNKERRLHFLDIVGSESCIFRGDIDQDYSSHAISWLLMRSLKIRHLKCSEMTDSMAVKIADFGSCLHWISLDNKRTNKDITDKGIDSIVQGCPYLQSLSIARCINITDKSVIQISRAYPKLQELDLSFCCNVTDVSIIRLTFDCPELWYLDISRCKITDLGLINIMAPLNLKSIYLNGCTRISDYGCRRFNDLHSLDISYCDITGDGLEKIAKGSPNLHKLILAECDLYDENIIVLAKHCPKLHFLRLDDCSDITDVSIISLADGCSNLYSLDLFRCTNITDDSIFRLAEKCLKLNSLELCGSEKVTDKSIINLVKQCPNLETLTLTECDCITMRQNVLKDLATLNKSDMCRLVYALK